MHLSVVLLFLPSILIDWQRVQVLHQITCGIKYGSTSVCLDLTRTCYPQEQEGIQTLACQLSGNSCCRSTMTRELENSNTNSRFVNSYQLSGNYCSRLARTRKLRKLSRKLSLLTPHQFSCNFCSRLINNWDWETPVQCLMQLLFLFDEKMRADSAFTQTFAPKLLKAALQLLFMFDLKMTVKKAFLPSLISKSHTTLAFAKLAHEN